MTVTGDLDIASCLGFAAFRFIPVNIAAVVIGVATNSVVRVMVVLLLKLPYSAFGSRR